MNNRRRLAWAISFAMLTAVPGIGSAQSDPTVDQIYQAANAGKVPQAQQMVDEVLRSHPDSAKAHYVKAELSARQRDGATAQRELASAERLAPGLPFAKPAAVQSLRAQVQQLSSAPAAGAGTRQMGGPGAPGPQAHTDNGMPWGKIAIGAAVLLGGLALMRRRMGGQTPGGSQAPFSGGPVSSGPAGTTGYGPGQAPGMSPGMQPGYAPGMQAGYGQPSMGSRIGGGLATGLAVGAGALAAGEIGRHLLHPDGSSVAGGAATGGGWDNAGSSNGDMGGQDFGLKDTNSWDNGAGGGADGGGNAFDSGDTGGGGGGGDWNS